MTFNKESRLGRDDKVISTDIGMDELSDELLGEPASIRRCGIDEIATSVNEATSQRANLTSVGLPAPCQGPQPNGRYLEAAGPDGSHAHVHPPRPRSP